MRIIVEQRSSDYKAYVEGDKKSWESGLSVDVAVEKIRQTYPELINAAVHVKG